MQHKTKALDRLYGCKNILTYAHAMSVILDDALKRLSSKFLNMSETNKTVQPQIIASSLKLWFFVLSMKVKPRRCASLFSRMQTAGLLMTLLNVRNA